MKLSKKEISLLEDIKFKPYGFRFIFTNGIPEANKEVISTFNKKLIILTRPETLHQIFPGCYVSDVTLSLKGLWYLFRKRI